MIDEQLQDKNKFSINQDLRPMSINIEKTLDMISNFKMENPHGERIVQSNQQK